MKEQEVVSYDEYRAEKKICCYFIFVLPPTETGKLPQETHRPQTSGPEIKTFKATHTCSSGILYSFHEYL